MTIRLPSIVLAAAAVTLAIPAGAQAPARHHALRNALQSRLDSLRIAQRIPGLTLALAWANGATLAIASGESDTARHVPMRASDRLLQGSVGKTYVAAVVMQLVHEGRLRLDDRVALHLGDAPWFRRLPNAADITVRQLLNHTSGLVRYEFNPKFTAELRANPMREWTREEQLSYLFDTKADFAAGTGWDYSDTNYILLGLIIERLTGGEYEAELKRRLLVPLQLSNTIPTDGPLLPGVVNGYAGPRNALGGYDASLVDGRFAMNPAFEWTGGGLASTTEDLARWGVLLYEGKAFDASLLPEMLAGVPARLGPDVRYGLGVIIRPSPWGDAYGHSGFFPGYATDLMYYPSLRLAIAVQANVTDPYPRGLGGFLHDVAGVVERMQ